MSETSIGKLLQRLRFRSEEGLGLSSGNLVLAEQKARIAEDYPSDAPRGGYYYSVSHSWEDHRGTPKLVSRVVLASGGEATFTTRVTPETKADMRFHFPHLTVEDAVLWDIHGLGRAFSINGELVPAEVYWNAVRGNQPAAEETPAYDPPPPLGREANVNEYEYTGNPAEGYVREVEYRGVVSSEDVKRVSARELQRYAGPANGLERHFVDGHIEVVPVDDEPVVDLGEAPVEVDVFASYRGRSLDQLLDAFSVMDTDEMNEALHGQEFDKGWFTATGAPGDIEYKFPHPPGMWSVVDDSGVRSYHLLESDAFAFRMALIQLILNGKG